MAKEMEVDFAIAAWQSFTELYVRLVVQELNKKDYLGIYFSGLSRDTDDHEFFLFRRSDDGESVVQQLACVSLIQSMEEGRWRELDVLFKFVVATKKEQRHIRTVALRILADLVAVYAFPRVTHNGKAVVPQSVPDPY
jgi:hypothetical protein